VKLNKFIFFLCFLTAILSSCGGSSSPVAPSAQPGPGNTTREEGTAAPVATIASAAPTAQPTQTLIPSNNIWIQGRLFLSGTETNSDCETGFTAFPTIMIWEKMENQDWQRVRTLEKPKPGEDDSYTSYYKCGKFGFHGSWIPEKDECFGGKKSIKVSAYYKNNKLSYQGESKVFTCPETISDLKIILEPSSIMMGTRNFPLL